eukprot:snap_masked-scaffold59_size442576-processed-gene-0.17 protein:Tk11668 transcript:snap_masked-scaffold59_size442576-processed-gene-0.17-mRNA-1 annotation:"nuclear receptor 1"
MSFEESGGASFPGTSSGDFALRDPEESLEGGEVVLEATEECQICKDPSIKHLHYGAITCFSCKAFFRRTSQGNANEKFVCKNSGECNVLHKLRKKCRKCRYEKCLQVGMKPSLVLTEEEKVKRFKKSLTKKAMEKHPKTERHPALMSMSGDKDLSRAVSSSSSMSYYEDPHEGRPPVHPGLMGRDKTPLDHIWGMSQRNGYPSYAKPAVTMADGIGNPYTRYKMVPKSIHLRSSYPGPSSIPVEAPPPGHPGYEEDIWNLHEERGQPVSNLRMENLQSLALDVDPGLAITESEVLLLQKLQHIHDSNYRSVAFGEDLIKSLVMSSAFGVPLSPSHTMMAYRLMIQRVTKVAQGLDEFTELPVEDQTMLLKSNADLMVSLKGAGFFDNKNRGIDQILYTLGIDDMDVAKRMVMTTSKTFGCMMNRIDYKSYNSLQDLTNQDMEQRYQWLLGQVAEVTTLFPSLTKLMTFVVLFLPPEDGVLKDGVRVCRMQKWLLNLAHKLVISQYSPEIGADLSMKITKICDYLKEITIIKRNRPLIAQVDENSPQPAGVN